MKIKTMLTALALVALLAGCGADESTTTNTTIHNGSGTVILHDGQGNTYIMPVPVETTNAARRF